LDSNALLVNLEAMGAAEKIDTFSIEEYLALETEADYRSFYYNGYIYAMTGASPRHNDIQTNLHHTLGGRFRSKACKTRGSDQTVGIQGLNTLYNYPDFVNVWGPPKYIGPKPLTLTNPTLLVEVLSSGTREFDLGKKAQIYRSIPTLRQYIMVDSEQVYVGIYTRQGISSWLFEEYDCLYSTFTALGESNTVAGLYEGIDFDNFTEA